jgi:hypothetical protein
MNNPIVDKILSYVQFRIESLKGVESLAERGKGCLVEAERTKAFIERALEEEEKNNG